MWLLLWGFRWGASLRLLLWRLRCGLSFCTGRCERGCLDEAFCRCSKVLFCHGLDETVRPLRSEGVTAKLARKRLRAKGW